jgi:hypothetical protein
LQDDSAGAFFVFYNSIQSFLGRTGFNQELLPALQFIADDLDLTVTPIDIDMPCVRAYGGGEQKLMFDWIEAQNEFSGTLCALLASHGVIATSATRSSNILVAYQFSGSGLQVLQDLLCLHHPRHIMTQAPAFKNVKASIPIMPANVYAGEQLNYLTVYFMALGNWEAHIKLYANAKYMRETSYHLLFIERLAASLKSQVLQKKIICSCFRGITEQVFLRIRHR